MIDALMLSRPIMNEKKLYGAEVGLITWRNLWKFIHAEIEFLSLDETI